jgi:microsomal dipeptidase-like Zn-dependent dipeptidase
MDERTQDFHDSLTVIDGCQFSNWFQCGFADTQVYNVNREHLGHWRAGGVTAVQVTVGTWESARPTLDTLVRWYRLLRDHADRVMPATSGADIAAAKAAGKTAVVLGFQNTSAFEDDLGLVEVFHRLGIRGAHATYNLQNFVGASCYDPVDSGLTRFGRFVRAEMNRLGMVMDPSHVGDRTALDCIAHSSLPVVVTHANPQFFFDHQRNKTDEILHAVADADGIIGLAIYPALRPKSTTLEAWCAMVARTVDLMGIEHVGLGSECAHGWTTEDAMTINIWHWSHEPDYGAHTVGHPGWDPLFDRWPSAAGYPNITAGLLAHGFTDDETAAVMGGNWMRIFSEGFEPQS